MLDLLKRLTDALNHKHDEEGFLMSSSPTCPTCMLIGEAQETIRRWEAQSIVIDLGRIDDRLVAVEVHRDGIGIGIQGYATFDSTSERPFFPIHVEMDRAFDPHPTLRVWNDINSETPQTLSMEWAAEGRRLEVGGRVVSQHHMFFGGHGTLKEISGDGACLVAIDGGPEVWIHISHLRPEVIEHGKPV